MYGLACTPVAGCIKQPDLIKITRTDTALACIDCCTTAYSLILSHHDKDMQCKIDTAVSNCACALRKWKELSASHLMNFGMLYQYTVGKAV